MTKDFFIVLLNQYLSNILTPRGESFEISDDIPILDNFNNISDGFYEIVWHSEIMKVIDIKTLKAHFYFIEMGRYICGNRVLYPSQFIHVKISDWRDYNLNKILN